MIFILEYDPKVGKLVRLDQYEDSQQEEASSIRLERELELRREGMTREVVLLNAESEAVIRVTHRRYFESLKEILQTMLDQPALAGRG